MSSGSILVVDDEKNIRRTLSMVLMSEDYEVLQAATAEEALQLLEGRYFDVVLLDVQLPGMNGLEALRRIKEGDRTTEVIMMSGHATLNDAVEATRLGAYDFFEKPLDRERVLITLRNCLERHQLNLQVQALAEKSDPFDMLGESPAMVQLRREIEKVAPTKGRVLITGESGVGKELVARAIHRLSNRRDRPFIKVNCAAIPGELIESELFGHEKGSFSGAAQRKRGKFELADRGTLFLDEIGDMSLPAQAKVLRVLQNGELYRVGSERVINVDVRVLAATNKDLAQEVSDGTFRQDLFFRLNVVPLEVPPLRERIEDVPMLVASFIQEFCDEYASKAKKVTEDVLNAMSGYGWPGNIRELKNLCERLVIMGGEPIGIGDLPEYITPRATPFAPAPNIPAGTMTLKDFRQHTERSYIESTLRAYGWNVSRTSEILGVERTNLHKKIKKYGIERDE